MFGSFLPIRVKTPHFNFAVNLYNKRKLVGFQGVVFFCVFWHCKGHALCLKVEEIKQHNFMNANPFNICPSCTYEETCVLTQSKEKVWSCSEYNEVKYKAAVYNEVAVEKPAQEVVAV